MCIYGFLGLSWVLITLSINWKSVYEAPVRVRTSSSKLCSYRVPVAPDVALRTSYRQLLTLHFVHPQQPAASVIASSPGYFVWLTV